MYFPIFTQETQEDLATKGLAQDSKFTRDSRVIQTKFPQKLPSTSCFQKRPTTVSSSSPSWSRMLSSSFPSSMGQGAPQKTAKFPHLPHPLSPSMSGNPKLRPTCPLRSSTGVSASCSPVKNRLRSSVGEKSPMSLPIGLPPGRFVRKDKSSSSYKS